MEGQASRVIASEDSRIRYPVPWKLVMGLTSHIRRGTRTNVDEFTRGIVARIQPPPLLFGLENLPEDPRFLLVANHYQRKGLWILHSAGVLTQAIRAHYGEGDPPVRWVVTANWPRWKIGPFSFRSPGDILLPRVAHALHCYAIPFAGKDPKRTARALRRILQEAPTLDRPIGLFPEGVAGTAGTLTEPLPGISRFVVQLARSGMPAVPCGISEGVTDTDEEAGPGQSRFIFRFGLPVAPDELRTAPDAAQLIFQRLGALL